MSRLGCFIRNRRWLKLWYVKWSISFLQDPLGTLVDIGSRNSRQKSENKHLFVQFRTMWTQATMLLQKLPMWKHAGDWGSIPSRHHYMLPCYPRSLHTRCQSPLQTDYWANEMFGLTQYSHSHTLTVSHAWVPICGGPYLSLRLSIGEPSLSGSLLLSGVPMQYRSLPTVIRKLCSSEDSERRLGERLCKLKKECKPINQGVLISATERQETLLNTWDVGWMDRLKKTTKLGEHLFQVFQLLIVTKEKGGY